MKVVVVGINHAGTSLIRTLKAFTKDVDITAYDRNDNISFLGCGVALWIGGVVKDPKTLFYANKGMLEGRKTKVYMKHDVIAINPGKKTIRVKNLETGEEFDDNYDKLVYAGGSWPITFKWEGMDLKGIHICKTYQHALKIIEDAKRTEVKEVTVVGAGYIGIELVEAFHRLGKKVHMIDILSHPVETYYGKEFTEPLLEAIKKAGVKIHMKEKVSGFKGRSGWVSKVITNQGEYRSHLVVIACGFSPNTQLFSDLDVERVRNGAIKVDSYSRAVKTMKIEEDGKRVYGVYGDIYVIGDSAAMYNAAVKQHTHTALATNAVKSGAAAAANIAGVGPVRLKSITGTNGLSVFNLKLASTGVTAKVARKYGLDVASTYFKDNERCEFMNEYSQVALKIVYEKGTHRLVGAQICSYGDENHSEVMYYLSLAIQQGLTLFDLLLSDVYFLPHYNKPFNFILSTILKALKVNL